MKSANEKKNGRAFVPTVGKKKKSYLSFQLNTNKHHIPSTVLSVRCYFESHFKH